MSEGFKELANNMVLFVAKLFEKSTDNINQLLTHVKCKKKLLHDNSQIARMSQLIGTK